MAPLDPVSSSEGAEPATDVGFDDGPPFPARETLNPDREAAWYDYWSRCGYGEMEAFYAEWGGVFERNYANNGTAPDACG